MPQREFFIPMLCCMATLASGYANAGILLTESFSYADGDLVGNGGWVNHNGTESFIQVSSGAAVLQHGSGSRENANTSFAAQSSGVLTAAFDLTVNASATIGGNDFEYFAHFYPSDDEFNFRSRTDVVAPNSGGDYTLGIATFSSTAEVTLPTDFSFGVVVPVSFTFDLDEGTSSLTAGGNTVNTTVVSLGQVIDAFALRQSNSGNDETLTVDNLVISHVPEPASLVLMFAGLLSIAATRRR